MTQEGTMKRWNELSVGRKILRCLLVGVGLLVVVEGFVALMFWILLTL